MAVRLDFEIAWDARKVQGLEKGISSLTKETSLFEKAFGKASKTVVHEAALMDASLQKLLSTLKAVSAETRSVRIPSGGRGTGSGSYATGGGRRSGKTPEQEAADSLAAQKRYYHNKALADAQRIADAKMMAAQEAAILRENNAAEERAAADSLAAQKEYYRRKNATDAYRERERRIMATRAARQEAAELRARGQDVAGAGLFDMARQEAYDRQAARSKSAMTVAARRTGGRSVSPVSAPDESFLGILKSASQMNSGGPLFNTAKFLADVNALPFGYERWGVRMAKSLEVAGKVFTTFGAQIAGLGLKGTATLKVITGIHGGISQMAKDGDRDAMRLAGSFSNLGQRIGEASVAFGTNMVSALTVFNSQIDRTIGKALQVTGVIKGLAETSSFAGDMIVFAASQIGAEELVLDQPGKRSRKKMDAARKMGGAMFSASVEERRARMEALREQDRIKESEDLKGLAGQKGLLTEQQRLKSIELAALPQPKEKNASDATPEWKAKNAEIEKTQKLIEDIEAREEEIRKERVRKTEEEFKKRFELEQEVSKLAKKARDEMKNGRQFDIDRVVHAKDLNQQLEIQIQQMEKLAREGKLTDEEKQERQQRIADILARQRQEEAHILELERARSGFALEIAQAQMDAGIDGIQRQAGFAREMIGHGSNYLDMLKRTNQISERQYNILKMQVAANPVEIEALKKEQAVEKEKLELARKKAAEDAKNAKTAQERMDAEKEHLRIVGQMQVQEVNHARQRAAAEENVAQAQRDQLAAQQMAKAQREAENAQKVGEQRIGAVQEQMQQQGPNQAAVQRQMFQGRMRSAVAEREKELGRKLNRREQAELYNEQRGQFVRDLRGPSDAQVRREAGRQRGDERRAAREANAANANLPPGLRAAENRFGAGQRANQEAARQEQIRSGAMRQAMMTGVNQEQAGAAGELAKQQIQILQQQGQLTEAQAEMMQQQVDFNTQMLQGQQAMMQLLQNVTMAINGQAQAAQANQQRARAQRAGNPR